MFCFVWRGVLTSQQGMTANMSSRNMALKRCIPVEIAAFPPTLLLHVPVQHRGGFSISFAVSFSSFLFLPIRTHTQGRLERCDGCAPPASSPSWAHVRQPRCASGLFFWSLYTIRRRKGLMLSTKFCEHRERKKKCCGAERPRNSSSRGWKVTAAAALLGRRR